MFAILQKQNSESGLLESDVDKKSELFTLVIIKSNSPVLGLGFFLCVNILPPFGISE